MANFAKDLLLGFSLGKGMQGMRRQREEDAWMQQATDQVAARNQQQAQLAQAVQEKIKASGLPLATNTGLEGAGAAPVAAGGGTAAAHSGSGVVTPAPGGPSPVGAGTADQAAPGAAPEWLTRVRDTLGLGPVRPRMPAWAINQALYGKQAGAYAPSGYTVGGALDPGSVDSPAGTSDALDTGSVEDMLAMRGVPNTAAFLRNARTARAAPASGGWSPAQPTPEALALARDLAPGYGLTVPQALALASVESDFNPSAVSPKGATGIAQVLPSTFREVMPQGNIKDPAQNFEAGLKYLAQNRDQFGGNLPRAVMAYNAGPGAVRAGKAQTYPETQQHLRRYLQALQTYRNLG